MPSLRYTSRELVLEVGVQWAFRRHYSTTWLNGRDLIAVRSPGRHQSSPLPGASSTNVAVCCVGTSWASRNTA